MIHSPTCQHAVRALTYLAKKNAPGPVLVREIAAAADVPRQSLAKILHGLRRHGLVRSYKGPGGGYRLQRPGSDIRLIEVIEAVDGKMELERQCVLGLDVCSDEHSCGLHADWKKFRDEYMVTVSTMTLMDAAFALEQKRAWGPTTSAGRGAPAPLTA